ncbi:MAG: alpha-amylase family glycosyl hydrolase [Chitinophagaceae bacterium]
MSEPFHPVSWSFNTNIYEVNLRQYTPEGSFTAFQYELPRLKEMGIETLWFMPVTPISILKRQGTLGSYYACSDYTSTNQEFGSLQQFKQLVEAAHALDMKVIIDWVANHTGWDHSWTIEHPDYYRRNWEGQFYDGNGWEDVIDLDYDNPAVRDAMIEAMKFWVEECEIDGFRCDMAMLVPLDFWVRVRTELDQIKKLFWLAECEEVSYHQVFDATYTWSFLHKMEAFWKNSTGISGLEEVLHRYGSAFPATAFHLFFTTNHDENSHSGSEFERLGDAAMALAVLCCTWKGLPLIYSGQELPNKKRLKFFDKDPIEWNGKYGLHDFFRKLLFLRKSNTALSAGTGTEIHRIPTNADDNIFAFLRRKGQAEVVVILNLSHNPQPFIQLKDQSFYGCFTDIFTGSETSFSPTSHLNLSPWQYAVYEKL